MTQFGLRLAVCSLIFFVTTVCPVLAEETEENIVPAGNAPAVVSVEEPLHTEAVAVYYATRCKGRRTRSCAHYNPQTLTAAHPSIPLGTRVKVVNSINDKSVVVTVNDRCRTHDYEPIDLSRKAARKLDFLRRGSARVQIIALED